MWFWSRWPCRLSFKFKRWTGCVIVSFAAARVGVTQCTSGPEDYNLSQINGKPRPHPPPRNGASWLHPWLCPKLKLCEGDALPEYSIRRIETYATFNCRLVSSVGRAPVCWGGGGVLSGRLVIRDGKQRLVVLRGWGLRSKYKKQQRGTSYCKGRGKQKEKHQCAMFWPGLICASEDKTEYWVGSFYVSSKLPTYPSTLITNINT